MRSPFKDSRFFIAILFSTLFLWNTAKYSTLFLWNTSCKFHINAIDEFLGYNDSQDR